MTEAHRRRATLALAWGLGGGIVVAARFRADWDWYRAVHRWLSGSGVPDSARAFDGLILFAATACIGGWLIARLWRLRFTATLRLGRGRAGWHWMLPASLAPMVGGGLVIGLAREGQDIPWGTLGPSLLSGVVRAPIAEELVFRGLLVAACAPALGWRGRAFWTNAAAAAVLFALTHVQWDVASIQHGWPTLLVTGLGGAWYAWLLSRWQTLWVPMMLHAGMNLGWLLAGAGGGAGGGGWMENLLRVATIAVATCWTVRTMRG